MLQVSCDNFVMFTESRLCWQVTDAEADEDTASQGSQLASQALHVLPFYSLLPADRQAKVCINSI